jgi:hypothetical protein
MVRRERKAQPDTRILVGMSFDKTGGSGEAAFRVARHFINGIEEKRIVGATTDSSGRASFITADDARKLTDVALVQASTGFETILLHLGDKCSRLKLGFVAGLIPLVEESAALIESLVRRARALLLVHRIELILFSSDFGGPNKSAMKILSMNAPWKLPKPIWETSQWPLTVEQMEAMNFNYYPVLFCPDVVEHWAKHAIYGFYEYMAVLGKGPKDSFDLPGIIFGLLGAKAVGDKYICSRPGEVDLCKLRDQSLVAILGDVEKAAAWHRRFRLEMKISTEHLQVHDEQATAPAVAVAMCYELFEEVGEKTLATFCKSVATLYMSARGRNVHGRPASTEECLEADRVAMAELTVYNNFINRNGNGRDAGLKRKRGGWTPDTWDAIEIAVASWARFVEMNKEVGLLDIRPDKISARSNDTFHRLLKKGGNAYLDVNETTQMGERHQHASLLRADSLGPVLTRRRTDKLYDTTGDAKEAAAFEGWRLSNEPLVEVKRRKKLAKPTTGDGVADMQLLIDVAAELTDKSASSKLKTSWRGEIVKGVSQKKRRAKTKKATLAILCRSPTGFQREKPQKNQFQIELLSLHVFQEAGGALFKRDPVLQDTMQLVVAPGLQTISVVLQSGRPTGSADMVAVSSLPRIPFVDLLGVTFFCDADLGVSSSGCVEMTFVVLDPWATDEASRRPVIIVAVPAFGDYLKLSHLYATSGLKQVIASSAFGEDSLPRARVRVIAAASALLKLDPPVDAAPNDEAPGKPEPFFECLGPGWATCSRGFLDSVMGLRLASEYVERGIEGELNARALGLFEYEF